MTNKRNAARHWLCVTVLCAGCTAQSPLVVPESTPTMIEIYKRHTVAASSPVHVSRHPDGSGRESKGSRIESSFTRNPVLHMYVFPHRSKEDGLWIPGYWTSFELYERYETQPIGDED